MRCPNCGTEAASSFCPNCGAPMTQAPAAPAGDPPAIAVLRKHAASGMMLAVLLLLALTALVQVFRSLSGYGSFFTLSINGEASPVGSLILTLLLLAIPVLCFRKLYSAARRSPGDRLPTSPATLAKVLSVIWLLFALLLAVGALALALAFLLPGSSFLEEIQARLQTMLPLEGTLDAGSILTLGCILLGLMALLELTASISLLRTSSKAQRMLRTGVAEKLSKLTAVTLLLNAGVLAFSGFSELANPGGLWSLLTNLLLGGLLVCLALLIFRARADLDRLGGPTAPAGPERV